MDDLKSNMDMFSSAESDMKSRFQQLKSHLLVVVYDQKSQSLEPDSSLMRLLELLKNDQVDAIFLSGGYEGFMSFIKEGRYNTRDFIEIGIDGKSSHQSSSSIQSKPTLTATRKSVSNLEPSVKMKGDSAPVAPIGSPEPSFLQSLANIELSGSELVRSSYQVGLGARGKARSSNGSSAREALTGVNSSLTPPSREGSGGQIARNVSDYVCHISKQRLLKYRLQSRATQPLLHISTSINHRIYTLENIRLPVDLILILVTLFLLTEMEIWNILLVKLRFDIRRYLLINPL